MIDKALHLPLGVRLDVYAARLSGRDAWVTAHHGALKALDLRAAIHIRSRVLKGSVVLAEKRRV